MKQENQKEKVRPQKKKPASQLLFLPILVILVIGILFFVTSNRQKKFTAPEEAGKKQHGIWESISQTFSEFKNKGDQQTNSLGPSEQEAKHRRKFNPDRN